MLFFTSAPSGGIFLYTVNTSSGQLTLGNSGQPISSDPATNMQVDPTNTLARGRCFGDLEPVCDSCELIHGSARLQHGGDRGVAEHNWTEPDCAASCSFSRRYFRAGRHGFSSARPSIPFNPNNANPFGTVGTIGVKNATGAALSVAFDPIPAGSTAPRLFYIGETVATSGSSNTGGLRAFNFSTTQEISGSPFAISGLAPYSILPFSTGDYVYVVSRQTSSSQTGVIAGFSIVSANSAFTLTALGSTFATGINPQAIVEDNTHAFVFAVNFGGTPDLNGYTLDTTHAGYLDQVITSATGTDPVQAGAMAALH